jgi:hypothetical protein
MTGQYKQLCTLLFGSALILVLVLWLFDDFLHARRFVEFGVEKQATILDLDHIIGGKSPQYVYSLQIDQTTLLKKFPYHWTLPIKRSFLVMSDSPGPDDIALGNRNSSAVVVLCYMEGCDKPGNLLVFSLAFLVAVIVVPIYWMKLIKNWETS